MEWNDNHPENIKRYRKLRHINITITDGQGTIRTIKLNDIKFLINELNKKIDLIKELKIPYDKKNEEKKLDFFTHKK